MRVIEHAVVSPQPTQNAAIVTRPQSASTQWTAFVTSRYGLEIRAATATEAPGLADLLATAGFAIDARDLAERLATLRQGSATALVALQWGPPSGLVVMHWYPVEVWA
jgi:hypothetical protein